MLSDVVVLDLGDEATALAGELLAELGATVIRVEDERGDELRRRPWPWAAVHHSGKQSIAIDTDRDDDWALVAARLGEVDVVIGPLQPGPATARFLRTVAARSGADDGPGLVTAVPRRGGPGEPATDLTVTAAGGLTWLSGHPDDPPNQPAGDLGHKQTALAAAEAAVALVTAKRTGQRPGWIEVSAQEAVAFTTLQTANGNIHHWHGTVPSRQTLLAGFTTVRAGDGRWTSFTIHPPNWSHFVTWAGEVLGSTGLDGPEWDDLDYVGANRAKVADVVSALAATLDRDELVAEGQRRGLLVLPVNELPAVAADRHLAARDFFVDVEQADGSTRRLPGSVFRSNLGRGRRGPAPALGADQHLLDGIGRAGAFAVDRPGPDHALRADADAAAAVAADADVAAEADGGGGGRRRPLAGVRIVDFCWAIAGPLTTRLLADLGADVIKLESHNRTDPIRYIGPQPADREGSVDTNGVFNDCSANKRAIALNVDTEAGRDVARRLIATADVVTANYTPDRLDRWGFDWDRLQQLRPGLIVANLAVMGTWGPDRGWRSYGSGLVAMSGLAAHTGFEGRVPECLGTLHTDFTVPYFAAVQIMAALHHRARTGAGAHLELSQYESAVRLLDVELAEVLAGGPSPGRLANGSPHCAPHGVFPAAGEDRWVAVAARNEGERAAVAAVIGAEPTEQAVAAWTSCRTREESVAAFRAAGVPVAAVADLADHQADPEMR
ncbi:MAG: CoA transferase, partial [Actinomycetota bacterium]